MKPAVVGCVGTAKNTGKTTALNAVLQEARRRGYRAALTSIGYDGEDVDNITGLPKPRVEVRPGDLVATATPCLEHSPAGWEVLADCGFPTALGPLVLARVTSPGRVILAGPSHRRGLARLRRLLARRGGADLLLVDGAFGRMSPLALAEGIVLSTGAARSRDPGELGSEARGVLEVLSLPRVPVRALRSWRPAVVRHLVGDGVDRAARLLAAGAVILVPGLVTPSGLGRLDGQVGGFLAAPQAQGEPRAGGRPRERGGPGCLVFSDPIQLLLGGDAARVSRLLGRLAARGVRLAVCRGPAILAVTVNPWYPEPEGGGRFRGAGVDPAALRAAVQARVGAAVPVVDVLRDGPQRLWDAVEAGLLARGSRDGTDGRQGP